MALKLIILSLNVVVILMRMQKKKEKTVRTPWHQYNYSFNWFRKYNDERNVENTVLTLTSHHESHHIVDEEDEVPEYTEPSDENIAIGSFVLVKVQSGKRKSTNFVYAAIIQDKLKNGYRVNGLKAIDTTRQSFKLVENDLLNVDLQDIALLNTRKSETSGNRVRYKFSHSAL